MHVGRARAFILGQILRRFELLMLEKLLLNKEVAPDLDPPALSGSTLMFRALGRHLQLAAVHRLAYAYGSQVVEGARYTDAPSTCQSLNFRECYGHSVRLRYRIVMGRLKGINLVPLTLFKKSPVCFDYIWCLFCHGIDCGLSITSADKRHDACIYHPDIICAIDAERWINNPSLVKWTHRTRSTRMPSRESCPTNVGFGGLKATLTCKTSVIRNSTTVLLQNLGHRFWPNNSLYKLDMACKHLDIKRMAKKIRIDKRWIRSIAGPDINASTGQRI